MSSANEAHSESAVSEIELLKVIIASLQRDQHVERQKRIWSTIAAFVLAAGAVATIRAEALTPPQVLVCKELKVVGSDGKTKLDLYTGPVSNGGSMKLYGSSGTALVVAGNIRDDSGKYFGSVSTYGDNGNARVSLAGETDTTAGAITVNGPDGKTRAAVTSFGGMPNGEFVSCDANGKAQKTFP